MHTIIANIYQLLALAEQAGVPKGSTMRSGFAPPFLFIAALSGCASIVEGTSQNILVNTNPPGADCGFYRKGVRIATVMGTPGSGLVNKTKHDIWIVCEKAGYQQASYFNHSGVAAGTFGNIVLGGGIGWAIDSASGADNKYDGTVNVSLVPSPGAAATALPLTFDGSAQPAAGAAALAPAEPPG